MVGRLRRSLNVLAAVDAAREVHPELRRPLTITTLRRVLATEEIDVIRLPIRAYAFVEGGLGSWIIVLRAGLNPRHERRILAHEYAHIRLHFAEATDAHEVIFQRTPCRRGDPTEIEAQLFARLLELGPDATPDHPDIAKFVAALDGPAIRKPLAPQIELPLPQPMPVYRTPSERVHGSAAGITAADVYPSQRKRRGPIRVPAPHSPYFDWSKDGKPLGWFHPELGWIWVYDGMLVGRDGKPRWVVLECGDRRAQRRIFIVGQHERRDYWFAEGEKRARTQDALTAQFNAVASQRRDAAGMDPTGTALRTGSHSG